MEESAQGRVWTGGDASSRGLIDAIGGMGRAVAIAKQKANIPQEQPVFPFNFMACSSLIFGVFLLASFSFCFGLV